MVNLEMLGALFALGAALFWAVAVILFKLAGDVFSPISLNIYKSIVAMALVSIAMLLFNIDFFPEVSIQDIGLLALSGFLGITLADICFFTALNKLGAQMIAVVECLYLPSVLVFSYLLLGERLGLWGLIGGALVLSAILVGTMAKRSNTTGTKKEVFELGVGVVVGLLAVMLMALGIVIVKEVLERTDVLWATLVRVVSGCLSLFVLVLLLPGRKRYLAELKWSRGWLTALPASVTGNFLALLCWVAGMKYTSASKAAILNQMATVFIFILAAVWLKERITVHKIIAICLAVCGAYLTIFYG